MACYIMMTVATPAYTKGASEYLILMKSSGTPLLAAFQGTCYNVVSDGLPDALLLNLMTPTPECSTRYVCHVYTYASLANP